MHIEGSRSTNLNIMKTDKNTIKEFLDRGIENIYPNREFVEKQLASGEKMKIYLGIDPTGPTLHIGHAIVLKKLGELQEMGHKIILLIGDFTALSGDPDKTSVRERMTKQKVKENAKKYKKQAKIFLKFSGSNKAELKHNSKWLGKMSFADVVDLASNFTVEHMLKRDLFKKRIEKGTPLYIHEFMYPLMQGYDSVAMDVDGEIGGNDQTFNMLAGRTLMKKMSNKEKFVVTSKLLADKDGKKMGKTEGNMITFEDSPEDMFGKVMSWTDGMIVIGFELCTNTSVEEIDKIKASIDKGDNPRDLKARLAREIVTIYHSDSDAKKADEAFIATFKDKGVPEEIPSVVVSKDSSLIDAVLEGGVVSSKSEFRRLVDQGAVKDTDSGEVIEDVNFEIKKISTYKIGKTRFLRVEVK